MVPRSSSPDSDAPSILTVEERRLLFRYCREHPVARCSACEVDYKLPQLGRHLFGPNSDVCPACGGSMVELIRAHIASCAVPRVQLSEMERQEKPGPSY
jgi:hypothetical protein